MEAVSRSKRSKKARKDRIPINIEREIYYYVRDLLKRPIVTVCLIQSDRGISRGLALCSLIEMPCKKHGRSIAKERALYALRVLYNDHPIARPEAKKVVYSDSAIDKTLYDLSVVDTDWYFKSRFDPVLSDFEITLLDLVNQEKNEIAA